MKNIFLKIANRIKSNTLYLKIRNRLLYYKGQDPLRVIVVGLPRSGTSFLTGLIVRMGFNPGPEDSLRGADQLNPYGYYENNKLMKIDHDLLKKFNGHVMSPPVLPAKWIDSCSKEKLKIKKIIETEGIQVYKGNMLVILADLYNDLFPNAKWIFISRNHDEIIRSLIDADKNNQHDRKHYQRIVEKWSNGWEVTDVAKKSLNIRYEDFHSDPQKLIKEITCFLDKEISAEIFEDCLKFFKPNLK